MTLKLGRRPALHTEQTAASAKRMKTALDALGNPPAVSDDYTSAVNEATGSNWGFLGNDVWGDCVEAWEAHYLMLRTANASSIVIPTSQQVLALYTAETGFNPSNPNTDNGTVETSDAIYMVTTGFMGHKADATASIHRIDLPNLKWCIQLFGGVTFGVNLPQSAMDQFNANQPWTVVKNSPIIGGHCPGGVGYDGKWFYVVTWGRIQPASYEWILTYNEEAHALLFKDWIKQNGNAPNNLDLAQLIADLPQVGDPEGPHHGGRRHKRRQRRRRQGAQQKVPFGANPPRNPFVR
jgi:hypothetical protein